MKAAKTFGGVKIALLGVLGAAVVAYGGYKFFFQRTGEAAAALIPADASFVMTIDAVPSEAQIPAFTKLTAALKKEGLDKDVASGVNDILGKAGLADEIRGYVTQNFAMAMWTPEDGKPKMLALFSISDRGGVEKVLSAGTRVEGAKVPAFRFKAEEAIVGVVGSYVAVATDVQTLNQCEDTRTGSSSIASLPEYREARAALPSDANVMCFVAPEALAKSFGMAGNEFLKTTKWMAFSAALRNGGIQFDYRGPVDSKTLASLDGVEPLGDDLLRKLPAGAYGVIAYSQPGKYYAMTRANLGEETKEFDKGVADFEKETGISVENDIVPALRGDVVLAAYPDLTGNAESADMVLMLTNAHGGNPAQLIEKVRAFIQRKISEESTKNPGKEVPQIVERQYAGATVFTLDEKAAAELRKGMAGGKEDAKAMKPFENKNIIVAVKDGTVYLCSSQAMLASMLSPQGGSLADDAAFADMAVQVGDRSQGTMMIAVGRLIEGFRAKLSESMKDPSMSVDDLLAVVGGKNAGLVASGKVDRQVGTGTFFLPLDTERVIHLIAEAKRNSEKQGSTMSETSISEGAPETQMVPDAPRATGSMEMATK